RFHLRRRPGFRVYASVERTVAFDQSRPTDSLPLAEDAGERGGKYGSEAEGIAAPGTGSQCPPRSPPPAGAGGTSFPAPSTADPSTSTRNAFPGQHHHSKQRRRR